MRGLLALLLCVSSLAHSAISYVGGTSGTNAGVFGTVTLTSQTAPGSNGIMIVAGSGYTATGLSSVDWNGQSFTQLTGVAYVSGQSYYASLWYLITGNSTATADIHCISNGLARQAVTAIYLSGVNQVSPVNTYNVGYNGSGTAVVTTITASSSTSALVAAIALASGQTASAAAGYTQRQTADEGVTSKGYLYTNLAPSVGSQSPSFTETNSAGPLSSLILAEFVAAASATVASQPLSPYHSNDLSPRMAPITRP